MEKINQCGDKEITIGDFFVPNLNQGNYSVFWKSAKYLYVADISNPTILVKNEFGKEMKISIEFFRAIINKNLLILIEEEVLKVKLLLSN